MSKRFSSGVICGAIVGCLLSSAVSSTAALGKNVWDDWGHPFQIGYVIGFFDSMSIARSQTKDMYFNKRFPFWDLKTVDYERWRKEVIAVYDEHKGTTSPTVPDAIATAAKNLSKKLDEPPVTRVWTLQDIAAELDKNRKKAKAAKAAKAGAAADEEVAESEADPAGSGKKEAAAAGGAKANSAKPSAGGVKYKSGGSAEE